MRSKLVDFFKKPFVLFVVLPTLIYASYQVFWATNRFESNAKMLVQQSNGTPVLDPTVALFSGIAGSSGSSDVELVREYIHSNDMLRQLNESLDLAGHYQSASIDAFSRLSVNATNEELLDYYIKRVKVEIDDKSKVLTVSAQGFEPAFTQKLTSSIAKRSEWFINKIGNDLAQSQLSFVKNEHELIERRLEQAKSSLLDFQRQFNLIDPVAESATLQRITSELDAKIASKEAQLKTLMNSMSENAAPVILLQQELLGLRTQLENERERMTTSLEFSNPNDVSPTGVNEILSQYSRYQVNLELASKAHTASQLSIEKARVDTYRQLKFLVMVENATLPEEARYPRVLYNCTLFLILSCIVFGIINVLITTFKELR